jgi:hypothetical protein
MVGVQASSRSWMNTFPENRCVIDAMLAHKSKDAIERGYKKIDVRGASARIGTGLGGLAARRTAGTETLIGCHGVDQ